MATSRMGGRQEARPQAGPPQVAPPAVSPAALWLACSRSPAYFLDRYGYVYDPTRRPERAGRASASGRPRCGRWRRWRPPAVRHPQGAPARHVVADRRLRPVADALPPGGHRAPLLAARRRGGAPAELPAARHVRPPAAPCCQAARGRPRQRARVPPVQRLGGAGVPHHRRPLLHRDAGDRGRGRLSHRRPGPAAQRGQADHRRGRPAGAALHRRTSPGPSRRSSASTGPPWRRARTITRRSSCPGTRTPAARPSGTPSRRDDVRARTGGLDDLYQEYPATDLEALAPRAVDKYFPAALLEPCYAPLPRHVMGDDDVARLQARADAAQAEWNRQYVRVNEATGELPPAPRARAIPSPCDIPGRGRVRPARPGAQLRDRRRPAGGNPQSDESAAAVLDTDTNEQVAVFGTRCDPELFAAPPGQPGPALRRRTGPGRAEQPRPRSAAGAAIHGPGANRAGPCAGVADDGCEQGAGVRPCGDRAAQPALVLHDEITYWQLASIDGGTLAAPPGQGEHRSHDDRAMACILALAAIEFCGAHRPVPSVIIPAVAGL